jgi:protein LTV1
MEDEDFEGSEFMSESDFDDAASTSTFAKAMRSQLLARADEDEPALTREDMEEIMDEFLDEFEIVGNKMLPKVRGETPAENLDIMRKALMGLDLEGSGPAEAGTPAADAEYIRKRFLREREEDDNEEEEKMPVLSIVGDKKDRWDAETILSELESYNPRS